MSNDKICKMQHQLKNNNSSEFESTNQTHDTVHTRHKNQYISYRRYYLHWIRRQ
jgi:hypothetical protein